MLLLKTYFLELWGNILYFFRKDAKRELVGIIPVFFHPKNLEVDKSVFRTFYEKIDILNFVKQIVHRLNWCHFKLSTISILSSFSSKDVFIIMQKIEKQEYVVENCKNLNASKIIGKFFSWLDHDHNLKDRSLPFTSASSNLLYFIEPWVLNDKNS